MPFATYRERKIAAACDSNLRLEVFTCAALNNGTRHGAVRHWPDGRHVSVADTCRHRYTVEPFQS
jgi:hypothetical protein